MVLKWKILKNAEKGHKFLQVLISNEFSTHKPVLRLVFKKRIHIYNTMQEIYI